MKKQQLVRSRLQAKAVNIKVPTAYLKLVYSKPIKKRNNYKSKKLHRLPVLNKTRKRLNTSFVNIKPKKFTP